MRRLRITPALCLLTMSATACLCTLAWATTSTSRTARILVGNPTVGPRVRSTHGGEAEAFRFRSRSAGTITAIRVYIDSHNAAKSIATGLYSNHNHRPGRRLTSGSLSRPKRGAWNTVIVRSATIAARQAYWIAVLGQRGKLSLRITAGARCSSEHSTRTGVKSLPLRWGQRRHSLSCAMSAYGTGRHPAAGVTVPGARDRAPGLSPHQRRRRPLAARPIRIRAPFRIRQTPACLRALRSPRYRGKSRVGRGGVGTPHTRSSISRPTVQL